MSEELGGIESQAGQESVSEVTAEDLVRVREDIKAAASTRSQIKQQGKRDMQNAKLLSLLLKYITEPKLIKHVFFFLVEKKADVMVIMALFIPVLQQYINIEPLQPLFHQFWPSPQGVDRNYHDVTAYYRALYENFELFETVDATTKKGLVEDVLAALGLQAEEESQK